MTIFRDLKVVVLLIDFIYDLRTVNYYQLLDKVLYIGRISVNCISAKNKWISDQECYPSPLRFRPHTAALTEENVNNFLGQLWNTLTTAQTRDYHMFRTIKEAFLEVIALGTLQLSRYWCAIG